MEDNTKVTLSEIKRVYEYWYCVSCKYSNEEPITLVTYIRIMESFPNDIKNVNQMLDQGILPGFRSRKDGE